MYDSILKSIKAFSILFILTSFLSVSLYGKEPEGVTIGKEFPRPPVRRKVSISISKFSPMKEAASKEYTPRYLTSILTDDLFMTGMFELREGPRAKEKKDLNFPKMMADRIEYAAIASYTVKKKEVILIGVLYNVNAMVKVFKKRYKGKKGMHRALVHQFAEDIRHRLFGGKGITNSRITFISDKSGHKEVYVVDYDGYNIRQLTRDRSIALLPRWSHDSKKIVYTSYKRRRPYLYTLDVVKGGSPRRLIEANYTNMGGNWSPEGRYLALSMSKKGNSDVYIYDERKNELRQLTKSWSIETSASWMSNGREILYTSDRSGKPQVYIIDVDGVNNRRLTHEGRYNDSAVCSPNGDRIAYISLENDKFNIYTMRFDGSDRTRLTYNESSNENPSWSPDGNYIVYTSVRGSKKGIYIMRADGEYEKLLFSEKGNCEDPAWSR